ncbi:hypothetical protein XELAEV_18040585mg [Xenopus laevis]|uniref:SGNH hydrolase-type esterase domain-containing protein n=1 Tax=Xenopus laevis TaxID=8355 RepID=A0A974H924_XENLA|nr:hypothetical protein XELAEV_18040585mg [Xenopus laevis]
MEYQSSVATLKRRVAEVAFFLKLMGKFDFTKTHLTKQILKGIARRNKAVDTRKPITMELLSKLVDVLPGVALSDYECILFRAVFIIAFFAALRVSKVVSPSRIKQGGLQVDDLTIIDGKLKIVVNNSKTDKDAKGPTIKIWIIGHSFIFWARRRAGIRSYGVNLSLDRQKCKIIWMGIRGLRWNDLISVLLQMLVKWGYPDIILIHLGGNDIGKIRTVDLISQIKRDLSQIRAMMEDVIIIWSEIVPRWVWFSPEKKLLEKCRKKVNHCVSKFVKTLNIIVFRHFYLEPVELGLYRKDGVHLSDIGNDIFNGLQTALEKALFIGGVSIAVRGF